MPKISFVKPKSPIEVQPGANLMRALLAADIPVASSCNGDAVCAKCRIKIVDGADNLSRENPLEKKLRLKDQIPADERVSCQTKVLGDVTIDTSYW